MQSIPLCRENVVDLIKHILNIWLNTFELWHYFFPAWVTEFISDKVGTIDDFHIGKDKTIINSCFSIIIKTKWILTGSEGFVICQQMPSFRKIIQADHFNSTEQKYFPQYWIFHSFCFLFHLLSGRLTKRALGVGRFIYLYVCF